MKKRKRRRLSAGSLVMLTLTGAVLILSLLLVIRLHGGKLPTISTPVTQALVGSENGAGTEAETPPEQSTEGSGEAQPRLTEMPRNTAPPAETDQAVLTVAGTLAIEKSLRQSCYAADTKVYDFTELLALLRNEVQGDLNAVFLENLLMEDTKVSELVLPRAAADLLRETGFQVCLSGFSKAWDKKAEGVAQTVSALRERGILPLGVLAEPADSRYAIREVNGIRIALMQYAADVPASVRKSMNKSGSEGMVPEADPEQIGEDIASAKAAGAEVCVVLVHWGKTGAKAPDKTQIALAQRIADSGADAIIGAGSRVAQSIEHLNAEDGRQVLCAWSLGTLMSDDRSAANRIGGFLLHLTFERNPADTVEITRVTYTPTYVWKYRQDNQYYYKCLAADRTPPDGMDNEQMGVMNRSLEAVQKALEDSPAVLR